VVRFNLDAGGFLGSWETCGELAPYNGEHLEMAVDTGGHVLIPGLYGHRVVAYDSTGAGWTDWPTDTSPPGIRLPFAVAASPPGCGRHDIWVLGMPPSGRRLVLAKYTANPTVVRLGTLVIQATPYAALLRWSAAADGPVQFEVQRSNAEEGGYAAVSQRFDRPAGQMDFSFADSMVRSGSTYFYRVGHRADCVWSYGNPEMVIVPPARLALGRPHPNPAKSGTSLAYEIPREASTSLAIYNSAGRRVRTLVGGVMARGTGSVWWDGHDDEGREVPSGVYLVRLDSGDLALNRRVVVVR
jgi:hypothetical protein